jgi:hypothetical protein
MAACAEAVQPHPIKFKQEHSMTQEATTHTSGHSETGAGLYATLTVTAAFVAASAAGLSLMLSIPPWAMFMGWVAYFTRKPSPSEGARTFVCIVVGLSLGAVATIATGSVAPTLGPLALPAVVLIIAIVVISTRGLPFLNNLLGYFLGLITFFAAHLPPTPSTIVQLAGAVAVGLVAGWTAQTTEAQVRKSRQH